jgi:3-deoxy-D-manno-octulosonic-acid transferase
VGEAKSALAIAEALWAQGYSSPMVLSVGTPAGLKFAQQELPSKIQLMAPPLDFWGAPGRCLDRLNPRALVIIETEIWPELINQCHLRGIPVMVISGRLSAKSSQGYQKIRFLIAPILSSISLLAAISGDDKDRFVDLGANPTRSCVLGSPKFDSLIRQARAELENRKNSEGLKGTDGLKEAADVSLAKGSQAKPAEDYQEPQNQPTIAAGSTHFGEEELVMSAIKELAPLKPNLLLAPRHLTRINQIQAIAAVMGFKAAVFSQCSTENLFLNAQVVIVDSMGVLASLYRRADLVLVGGSFFKGAGHNPLEPAVFGKPVIFGPHMSSFKSEAQSLLACGAAVQAEPDGLSEAINRFLTDQNLAKRAGMAGLSHLASLKPVAPVLARAVLDNLNSHEKPQP